MPEPASSLHPFISEGEGDARFYTLAYCRGERPDAAGPSTPAFLSINFSTAPRFTRFSTDVRTVDGRTLYYHRGDDDLDTLECAILHAWEDHDVSPDLWRLYPLPPADGPGPWSDRPADRAPYLEARDRACRIFWRARANRRIRRRFGPRLRPQFVVDPDPDPDSRSDPSDAAEVEARAARRVADRSGTGDD